MTSRRGAAFGAGSSGGHVFGARRRLDPDVEIVVAERRPAGGASHAGNYRARIAAASVSWRGAVADIDVLPDTIQPYPTSSEASFNPLCELEDRLAA